MIGFQSSNTPEFFPSNNEDFDNSMCSVDDFESKYKTELCKNWIEIGVCRYGSMCRFAHGYDELSVHKQAKINNEKLKTKNCRSFYQDKICLYGSRCMFRHEHRSYKQLFRHFYVPHLFALEQLFDNNQDKTAFVNSYVSQVPRLQIFNQITDQDTDSDCDESVIMNELADSLELLKLKNMSQFTLPIDSIEKSPREDSSLS